MQSAAGPVALSQHMRPQNNNDAEIIDRLCKRDPDGLAAAYDRYGPLVYSVFLRITRDQSAAEDLMQELFMRLWNRAKEFDSKKGALGVWLISIARNMGIDYVRSAQARFATRLQPIEHIDQLHFAEKRVERESVIDRARAVKAALASLNANQKRVLELAYFEGYSQTEIAAELHEPLGTVKSWMRSALTRLRMSIKAEANG